MMIKILYLSRIADGNVIHVALILYIFLFAIIYQRFKCFSLFYIYCLFYTMYVYIVVDLKSRLNILD